jgi:YD repeat-containing protein
VTEGLAPRRRRRLGALCGYAYDAAGCLARWEDALRHVASYEYDAAGRMTR